MPNAVAPRIATSVDTVLETLANGVRIVAIPQPHLSTVAISVFVRSGSDHESAPQNGVSHVVEHMAFKGTRQKTCQQINLDAERLGADVDAHTDKDHTAFHMRGLPRDAGALVAMLGEIVTQCSFPAFELEQERQVLLQEFAEDHDDVEATAFKCFDRACYGEHPAAQPVIGTRSNLRRFKRDDLVAHIARHYTGTNTVVAVIGDIDADAIVPVAGNAFGAMPRGEAPSATAPAWIGGHRARRMAGSSQAQVIVGFPMPPRPGAHEPYAVAAAVFGEGMSSPLLDELRERRGIVYHANCSAEVRDLCGQFVIEASTTPDNLRTYGTEVARLLREHAGTIDPVALGRARNQIGVRLACEHESPPGRIERAALDLFAYGRILGLAERMDRIAQVGSDDVRDAFARMLEAPAAIAIAGAYGRGEESRLAEVLPGAAGP